MDDKRYIDRKIDRAKMCSFDDWKLDFSTYRASSARLHTRL
jgi:hypothetical protein